MGGHRPRVLAGERDWLLARLAEKPDLTLRAVVAELVGRGVPASYGAVWRLLKAEGVTVKKSLFAAEKDRPDLACRRQRWKHQSRLDPHRLVFIDETPAFAGTGSGPRPT
jgi:transposase